MIVAYKESGAEFVTKGEVEHVIKMLLFSPLSTLAQMAADPDIPTAVQIVIKSLIKSLESGDSGTVLKLFGMLYGDGVSQPDVHPTVINIIDRSNESSS